ncbi:4-hydroxy-tetrahydrodipicolinate reductase [Campylobacter novaezeelandiae]|uniref:4-hydroxy-tetrahydrodipicolinate reductase n=1 Tax=Campylobacter novaezeelandiae TaxID=2267891 RepID=A0A4Q9JXM4_9BACT|nr:4-hydroxy-tetrahydrodipicolinate reductase [Campylobacter novaezeelandiae]TBR79566.1 4-hydroxy-tetrahydrodipicolinate reductase [Campylobacter novaezeelandiae]TBR82491.1 4-hydroxy-tetrahydrodipicolinate reductase [Campylobacter novaezeelandiae]
MVEIGIYGACGRMGRQIQECLEFDDEARVSVLYDKNGNLEELFKKSDVIIDFSSPYGTNELLEFSKNNHKPLVIGTTGLDEKVMKLMYNLSKSMPIFYATNMSLGVAVLNYLASKASIMLKNFDIEIVEMHHRHKKDSPSGTALTLAENVAKTRNLQLQNIRISGRDGISGERSKDEIAVMSLRGGDIVGRHTIGFYEEGEYLELTHNATSRATFAKGAIKIAKWLIQKEPKLYSMNDFLGI